MTVRDDQFPALLSHPLFSTPTCQGPCYVWSVFPGRFFYSPQGPRRRCFFFFCISVEPLPLAFFLPSRGTYFLTPSAGFSFAGFGRCAIDALHCLVLCLFVLVVFGLLVSHPLVLRQALLWLGIWSSFVPPAQGNPPNQPN